MPGFAGGYATQLRIRDYAGGFAASIRGEQTKTWRELWHTGNFDPTGKANVTGSTANDFKAAYYSCSDSKTMGIAAGNYSGALNNNDVFLMTWDTVSGSSALLSKEDPYFMRIGEWAKRPLWHSGNPGLPPAARRCLFSPPPAKKTR